MLTEHLMSFFLIAGIVVVGCISIGAMLACITWLVQMFYKTSNVFYWTVVIMRAVRDDRKPLGEITAQHRSIRAQLESTQKRLAQFQLTRWSVRYDDGSEGIHDDYSYVQQRASNFEGSTIAPLYEKISDD